MKDIYKRLLDICFKRKLHHLGSYFSSLGMLNDIYSQMDDDDVFILSNGHAVVALYVILEQYHNLDAEELLDKYGEHPKRNELDKIYCSTGSLGMGLPIAVGRAMGNKNITVHCMISDGECAEGSIWESLRFAYESKLDNLKIYVNANGWSAYDAVDIDYLQKRIHAFHPGVIFCKTTVEHFGLKGVDAHYDNLTEEQYLNALQSL